MGNVQNGGKGKGTSSMAADADREYKKLSAKYKELNRDHEDLLVFVGHLHDKFESSQREMSALQSRVQGGQNSKKKKKTVVTEEAKSFDTDKSQMSQNAKHRANVNDNADPFAPPDLM